MEYRHLGGSGLKVPVLTLGTGTFGGKGEFFSAWGASGVPEATRLVDICLEAGLNMFDSADFYSGGIAEFISVANGIWRDRQAVEAALTHPESQGQTEGFVNKLKFIKRSGYGRSGFDLLRIRVLLAS